MPDGVKFTEVLLAELADEGVLMAANERFFWPLGLALTWLVEDGVLDEGSLHIREWVYADGHHECIESDPDDVLVTKREHFGRWLVERAASMPKWEGQAARIATEVRPMSAAFIEANANE